jgi:hypothetical protein
MTLKKMHTWFDHQYDIFIQQVKREQCLLNDRRDRLTEACRRDEGLSRVDDSVGRTLIALAYRVVVLLVA